ncbi:acylneuraminate cytidylyltransferase family protein [Rossellomorea vietnamensis]|uniref:Acylneuraminate cytidylyltransferase family protein n=1 Tax=Rossellomorea vietnamensis TaxID=218284 RepID=A0A5D4M2P2_9BACI|nr:acylneuraminate cytidylyltransferase family protein [Rossellomorea vietnamensis]TYR95916.1 acylneuraminate cytidylyltransferase family protein [Rossellomorea vietnamensis]
MSKPVVAFLPCRKGSQRVIKKNIRTFAELEGGLTRIKAQQLNECELIDKIVISTDDEEVISICDEVLKNSSKSVVIDRRPKELASSETSTDDLINYVGTLIPEGEVLWTHVTSPFINSDIYSKAIRLYLNAKKQELADSLTTVTKHQKYFWNSNGKPINYDRAVEKWPRTQTMEPMYELNSGIFLCDSSIYLIKNDRVGDQPYLYELSNIEAMDVDWEEDFELAEILWSKKYSK